MRLFSGLSASLVVGLLLTSCSLAPISARLAGEQAVNRTSAEPEPPERTNSVVPAAPMVQPASSAVSADALVGPAISTALSAETSPSPIPDPSPTPAPDRWLQTFLPAPLLAGPNPQAKQFSVLPPFSYLKVLKQAGEYFYVLNPATNGPAYVAASRVGPSGPPPPPPPFRAFWVQNFRTTQLWSSPAANAVSFGTLPAWHFFDAVGPGAGARLLVTVDRGNQIAYVDRSDVGPSGPPTAAVPGFLDIASGGRLAQLPGWPEIAAQTTASQQLRPGVVLSNVDLMTSIGPLHIHQITIDLTSPGLHLSSVLAHNSVVSSGETVSSMANRTGALVGINGDYFAIHASGVPLNMTVQNGNLIRSGNNWAVFAVGSNNLPDIGKFDWRGSVSVLSDARLRFPIAAVNLPLMDHSIVAVNQSMGSVLAAQQATLAYLAPEPTPGIYRVRAVAQRQSTVPPVSGSDIVLAGEGVAATWLAQYAPVGSQVRLDYRTQPSWQGVKTAVGGGPILVQNGLPYQDSEAPAPFEADALYPVSGVGVSRDGRTLWLVAVDGHEGDPAYGLTRPQFAWYFQTIGAWEAMAFDSGGSATLVARLAGQHTVSVINTPADGVERPVADGLFIYG